MIASRSHCPKKKEEKKKRNDNESTSKKQCAEEEKMKESRDSNRLWTIQMNSSTKCCFSTHSPPTGCFVFNEKLWRRPWRVFSTVYFSSEEQQRIVVSCMAYTNLFRPTEFDCSWIKYFRLSQRMKWPVGSDRIHWHKSHLHSSGRRKKYR